MSSEENCQTKDELIADLQSENEELRKKLQEVTAFHVPSSRQLMDITKQISRFFVWLTLGPRVYKKSLHFLDSLFLWIKSPNSEVNRFEGASKELIAAIIAQFSRVGIIAIIGLLLGLIPLIFLYQQNNILKNQNLSLKRQNSLIAFEQTNNIRDMISKSSDSINVSIINQLVALSITEGEIFIPIIRNLVDDSSSLVSASAILALCDLETKGVIEEGVSGLDFSGRNFSGLTLDGIIFRDCIFREAKFINTSLIGSDFRNADLRNADFSSADLSFSNLSNTNLKRANIAGARLYFSNLSQATLGDEKIGRLENNDILGWESALDYKGVNIKDTLHPPKGFSEYVMDRGAVRVSDVEWLKLTRKMKRESP